jgi:hypothetical protein
MEHFGKQLWSGKGRWERMFALFDLLVGRSDTWKTWVGEVAAREQMPASQKTS